VSGRRGYSYTAPPGAAAAVLTAPTPPAQGPPEPAGTTSVSLTWTHAGAPGGLTYALTATDTATGDPVVPTSGSGLGPYALPTSDGQEIICTLLCTRTADGQTARSLPYYVAINEVAPATPGWDVALDLDLTGLTSATLADDTTTVVTRAAGGANVATVWASEVSNGGTVTAGSTGLVVSGAAGTGSVSALIDVGAAAGLTLPADIMAGVAIDLYMDALGDWVTATSAWRAGLSATQARFSVSSSNTVQGRLNGALQDRRVASDESFTTVATAEALPSGAWVVTLRVDSGSVCWAWYGTTPPSDADLDSLTGAVLLSASVTADISSPAAGTRYGAALHAGVMSQLQPVFTWTRMRVRTRRTA
jgi:hypothetical protein